MGMVMITFFFSFSFLVFLEQRRADTGSRSKLMQEGNVYCRCTGCDGTTKETRQSSDMWIKRKDP
jgi:hypothetical protein